MKLFSKTTQPRTIIISLLMIAVVNLTGVPRVQAGDCSKWDILTLGVTCLAKKFIKSGAKKAGEGLAEGIRPDFDQMVDQGGQKLASHINSVDWSKIGQEIGKGASEEVVAALNSIDWEQYGQQIGAGIRSEFEVAMNKLFDEQIKPLLKDIDNLLEQRINQADNVLETRLNQLDDLIDDKLEKVDILIKDTFDQFQAAADETIAKVQTEIIDYAFDRFQAERDETVAQIRAQLIDYAATTVNQTTDEVVTKVKTELIDKTVTELTQLKNQFRQDVEHFFNRAENLLVLLDCTEEKTRIDMENLIKQLGQEIADNCPPMLCGLSGNAAAEDPIISACYKKLHLSQPPKSWQYSMIYRLEKCEVLRRLTPKTPTENVAAVYLDLHNWAKRIACIQRSPEPMWESLDFKSRYQFWSDYRY